MDAWMLGSMNWGYRVQYERDGCFGAVGLETFLFFCWAISGRFLWSLLGQAWDNLEASSGHLGAILGPLGGICGSSSGLISHICGSSGHLWASGGHVVASWGDLGAILRPGWAVLALLRASGRHLLAILRQPWGLWIQSWGFLVAS